VDPLAEKYPGVSPYAYCLNNPVNAIDPDGGDVIILRNTAGASKYGHQAILVGNTKDGWLYISKDGAAKSGATYGKSRYTAKHFKSLDEFKNSAHNFEVIDGTNHSKVGGGEESKMTFKLDSEGNKIQRYDQAYYIDTDDDYDGYAAYKALETAKEDYELVSNDCSNVPKTFLDYAKDKDGNELKNGEKKSKWYEIRKNFKPNEKQKQIESRNKGTIYDSKVKPSTTKLQKGEKGKKED
jgi:hypothetical protein